MKNLVVVLAMLILTGVSMFSRIKSHRKVNRTY